MKEGLETKGLDKLIRLFGKEQAHMRIGILGSSARSSKGGAATNAVVGAAHEYGTSTLPKRSFLRQPLSEELDKKLYKDGKFSAAELKSMLQQLSVKGWLTRMAILAEQTVQEAFDTGGFGKWKKSNMSRKKNHQTLVETQQLRRSITSEVKE